MGPSSKLTDEEANSLSLELGSLTRRQYEALQKSPYLRMSKKEAEDYDRRRLRIGEISDLLAKFRGL
jgi:hypothetical protein